MIVEACQDFQVDPAVDCVFIGDTLTDLQAAAAGGIEKRILVQTGYGFSLMGNIPASNYPQLIRGHDSLIKDLELRSVAPFYYAQTWQRQLTTV
jgi:phosphoglycolate phosphatase-like HAD superfamily hydrolase